MASPLTRQLTQRFFRYLAITSQSDPRATTLPTTPGQHQMAQALADELRQFGLDDIVVDEHATVTAVKKAPSPVRRGSALSRILIPLMSDCRRIFIHKSCDLLVKISALTRNSKSGCGLTSIRKSWPIVMKRLFSATAPAYWAPITKRR